MNHSAGRLWVMACTTLLLAFACTEDDSNHAPEIQSVSSSPTSVVAGGLTILTCTATDVEGNALEYSWSSPQGTFPSGSAQSSVQWQAPATGGTYAITVEVSDGQVVDTDTVAVQVSVTTNTAMITIPAGQFAMGQTGVDGPEHEVTLTHSFELGLTEVTNEQFLEALNWAQTQGLVTVVGDSVRQYGVSLLKIGSDHDWYEIRYNSDTQQFYQQAGTYGTGGYGPGESYPGGNYDPSTHPVMWVSWYGAACYCDWLSQMNSLPAYYNGNWWQIPSSINPYAATGYRLPTEAEWEFAAQFSNDRTYPWGDAAPSPCEHANYDLCLGWTAPVGSYPAGDSELELKDMAGNVWEWCNDWNSSYSTSPQSNPAGPASGYYRVFRGGGWSSRTAFLPSASRNGSIPSTEAYNIGFRLCRTLP